jgi:hypothetical protein
MDRSPPRGVAQRVEEMDVGVPVGRPRVRPLQDCSAPRQRDISDYRHQPTVDATRALRLWSHARAQGGRWGRRHAVREDVGRDDAKEVDALCRLLEAAGARSCRDVDRILPGNDWKTKIRGAIESGAGSSHGSLRCLRCSEYNGRQIGNSLD